MDLCKRDSYLLYLMKYFSIAMTPIFDVGVIRGHTEKGL
jgi:hypothetical protein